MMEANDCKVLLAPPGQPEVELAYGTDFTVTGTRGAGFVAVLNTAPASGVKIVVYRKTDRTRAVDYQQTGILRTTVLNDDFDRAIMINQEQQEEIDRGFAFSISENEGWELPGREAMKGQYLYFDENGDPQPGLPIGAGNWSQYSTYQIGALVASNGVLYRSLTVNNNKPPASNPTDWVQVAAQIWDAARTYSINDPVFDNGLPYRAKTSNTNKQPSINPLDWEYLGPSTTAISEVVTASTTIAVTTKIVLVNTASAITLTIPEGLPIGHEIVIQRIVTGADITVSRSGSETIIGGTSATIQANNAFVGTTVYRKTSATAWQSGAEVGALVRAEYTGLSIITPPTSPTWNVVNFETLVQDTHNAVTNPSGNWTFTVPIDGIYVVEVGLESSSATTSVNCTIYFALDGSLTNIIGRQSVIASLGGFDIGTVTSGHRRMTKGQTIKVRWLSNVATTGNLTNRRIIVTRIGS